tara:strand:+ start:405 stop:1577 length:1173 start_codon:yes stop_codon:yes gene_type:complete
MKHEITIFGYGISAKITSILLAKSGFKVCLISDQDQNQERKDTNLVTFLSSNSFNYLTLMIPSMRLFNETPAIQIIKCQLKNLSEKKPQLIEFKSEEEGNLGKIVKNSQLENCLDIEINQLQNIHIINSNQPNLIKNSSDGVQLKLVNGEQIDTEIFILSSTKSNVAEQTEVKFVKKDLGQKALSINIKGKIKNKNCAFQEFSSDGPIALLPYSKDEASIVWSLKNNSKILQLTEEDLTQTIGNHLKEHISSVKIQSIEKFNLQFVYATNLFNKNTVLIGNIAHNIHPIAGQGLNLSIKDVALLVKKINKYKSLGYKLNDQTMLEEFEIERKLDNVAYSFGTFSLNGILSSNNKLINYTARKGLSLIENNKYLKRLFVKSATGEDFFKSF